MARLSQTGEYAVELATGLPADQQSLYGFNFLVLVRAPPPETYPYSLILNTTHHVDCLYLSGRVELS